MFEQFSRGYYLGRLYVEPRAGERATMCREQHRRLNERLYADDEGVERVDRPLVMKLGTRHFPVHGGEDVPADTLSVPPDVLADADVHNPPSLREVFLAKAHRAAQLLRLTGGSVAESARPPDADGAATDPDARFFDPDGPDGPAGI